MDFDIKGWLRAQHVDVELYSADDLIAAFVEEMEAGLAQSGAGSLEMIPAYVGTDREVPRGQSVAVIDAGGTNLRSGLAAFDAQGNLALADHLIFSQQVAQLRYQWC